MTSLTHNGLILTLFIISIASIFAATVNGVEIFSPPYPTVVIQEAEGVVGL